MGTGGPERSATLVVRVWTEGDRPDAFRARITRIAHLDTDELQVSVQSDSAAVCRAVCAWLEEFGWPPA